MTAFDATTIGTPTEWKTFTLESDAGITYAQATNDPTPAHNDGSLIPPVYAVVPVWDQVFEVVSNIVPMDHLFSIVHGEQDMMFFAPLNAGRTLRSRAIGEAISVKDSGTTLVVKTESIDDATEEKVVEQYFTMFFRSVDGEVSVGQPHSTGLDVEAYGMIVSSEDNDTYVGSVVAHLDDDQTFRYAEASGDQMPIHLDDDFAKSVGLPGIIIHGLCTMAQLSWAAISTLADSDPTRLSRIAVRFSKPLLPGDDLRSSFFHAGEAYPSENESFLAVSTRVENGDVILTNSLVEVAKWLK